jgi:hypothetical protein
LSLFFSHVANSSRDYRSSVVIPVESSSTRLV